MKTEFSWQIFDECSNIKFYENSSSGADLFYVGGRTDGLEEANSRLLQFFEGA
jgi:hypothetical protein